MRILLIGENQAAAAFYEYFKKDDTNIVFNSKDIENLKEDAGEIKDFALANEIDLVVLFDEALILSDIVSELTESGLSVLAPFGEVVKIFSSKSWAKKFIYRNKILTPKFQIFEKAQTAIDYIRQNRLPVAIKPDCHSAISTRLTETFGAAKAAVEEFFATGAKKVIVEEYIWGKEFSVYALLDGFNPVVLADVKTYQNSIAELDADFLTLELKSKIYNDIIIPITSTLVREYGEYTGILGFDFILAKDKIYLLECNPMFKDLDAKMIVEGTKENWGEVFNSAFEGTMVEKFPCPKLKDKFAFSYQGYVEGKKAVYTAFGRTLNEAKTMLFEECECEKEFLEAQKVWKM